MDMGGIAWVIIEVIKVSCFFLILLQVLTKDLGGNSKIGRASCRERV